MAQPRSSTAFVPSLRADYAEIVDWYRDMLDNTAPPEDLAWQPVKIGPTWQYEGGWLLPDASLGWDRMAWCGYWLRGKGGKPWTFTPEQARFILWYDAVDSAGDHLYHSAMLQRLKGWGKDPLGATISAVVAARGHRVRPLGG
jgi:hypothetical protein